MLKTTLPQSEHWQSIYRPGAKRNKTDDITFRHRPPSSRIGTVHSIIPHHKIFITFQIDRGIRNSFDAGRQVGAFIQSQPAGILRVVYGHLAVFYFNFFSRQADDSFDEKTIKNFNLVYEITKKNLKNFVDIPVMNKISYLLNKKLLKKLI